MAPPASAAPDHPRIVRDELPAPSAPSPCRTDKLHADKAYDFRRYLHRRGIGCRIARTGIESGEKHGRHRADHTFLQIVGVRPHTQSLTKPSSLATPL